MTIHFKSLFFVLIFLGAYSSMVHSATNTTQYGGNLLELIAQVPDSVKYASAGICIASALCARTWIGFFCGVGIPCGIFALGVQLAQWYVHANVTTSTVNEELSPEIQERRQKARDRAMERREEVRERR